MKIHLLSLRNHKKYFSLDRGNIGCPLFPATANAIFDAVGIRIKELPITPEKVLAA